MAPALGVLVLLAAGHWLELCVGPRTQGLEVLKVMSWEEEEERERTKVVKHQTAWASVFFPTTHHGPGVAPVLFHSTFPPLLTFSDSLTPVPGAGG